MEHNLPKVGKTYKFYDDGKLNHSRQYDAKVIRIIPKEEAKSVMFPTYCCDASDYEEVTTVYKDEQPVGKKSLNDVWIEEVKHCDWVFATDTDYFIECSIPRYDENNIWFARMLDGNWFSMDIQCFWQGGKLDVDNHLTEMMEEAYRESEKEFGKK